MDTDYSVAIASVLGLVVLLTSLTVFVLRRPSDLVSTNPEAR